MKSFVVLLAVLFLSSCGTYMTLEELEDEAVRTGDWSRVLAREEAQRRWARKDGYSCTGGRMAICEQIGPTMFCSCNHTYNTSGPVRSILGN